MPISPDRARDYASRIEGWGNNGRDPGYYHARLPTQEVRGLDVPGGVIRDLADQLDRRNVLLQAGCSIVPSAKRPGCDVVIQRADGCHILAAEGLDEATAAIVRTAVETTLAKLLRLSAQ